MFAGLIRYSGGISVLERLLLKSSDVPPIGLDAFRRNTGRSYLGHVAIAADNTIVVAESSGYLAAYTPSGTEIWRVALGAFGNSAVPSITADGTIYVMTYDIFPNSQQLLAVSLATGAVLWSQPLSSQGSGLAIAADGTLYVTLYDRLEARSPAGGGLLWTLPVPTDISFSGAPAVGPSGDIYVGGFGGLTAVTPDGAVRWVNRGDGSRTHVPALSNDGGTIYVTTDSPNRMVAVESSSGTTLWSTLFANTELATPPVVGLGPDGVTTIYAAAIDDRLVAITPGGILKWSYTALPPGSGDNPSGAPAVASNGTVVLATTDGAVHMVSSAGTPLFKGSVLGYPSGAVVIDRRGAAIVLGSCGAFGGACGLTAMFTGGTGPAPSWSKIQGSLDNSGRR
jgi:outer membrane protein assembly factor BamB